MALFPEASAKGRENSRILPAENPLHKGVGIFVGIAAW